MGFLVTEEERFMIRTGAVSTIARSLAGIALLVFVGGVTAGEAQTLLSQGKPVVASSTENAGTSAANAVDGSTSTRWSSAFSDPQWIRVDLGASQTITRVVLIWEAAYA